MVARLTRRILFAAACCLALVFLPLSTGALAQEGLWNKTKKGVQKGAEAVKKGAETAGEKTKEGAEAVGHGVKKAVTGEDTKDTDTSTDREKGTQNQTESSGNMPSKTDSTPTGSAQTDSQGAGKRDLPATAGELPLLASIGALALAGAGISKVIRRLSKSE